MNEKTYQFFIASHIDASKIDKASGVIPDVRVITEGVAMGHGVRVDEKTIDQLITGAQKYSNGVKVKLDHEGGSESIVGWVNNFRKAQDADGFYLLGDLHLIQSHPRFTYLLDLVSSIPDTFGLSVFFIGQPEEIDGETYARCNKLFSCDIVTEPAANPAGMFSIGPIMRSTDTKEEKPKVDNKTKRMTPEEFEQMLKACMTKMNASGSEDAADTEEATGPEIKKSSHLKSDGSLVEKTEKHHPAPKDQEDGDDDDGDESEMSAKIDRDAKKFAAGFMKTLAASGIRIPSNNTNADTTQLNANKPKELKDEKFEDICVRLRAEGFEGEKFTEGKEIRFAMKKFPAAHQDFLDRAQKDTPMLLAQRDASSKGRLIDFNPVADHWKVQGKSRHSSEYFNV